MKAAYTSRQTCAQRLIIHLKFNTHTNNIIYMYVCVYATHAIILTIKKMMITIIIIMRNSHLTTKLANSIINNILFFIFCVWLFLERFVLIFVFTLLSFFFSSYFLDFSKFFITIHNNIYIYICILRL